MKTGQSSECKKLFIFVGPPGAGKGSLSRLLQKEQGWRILSTGDQLRYHVSQGTQLGNKIDFFLKSGSLVPDELVLNLVRYWLESQPEDAPGVVIDGFPRTLKQAKSLLAMLTKGFPDFCPVIVKMNISDDVVKDRIAGRLTCSNIDCQAVSNSKALQQLDGKRTPCFSCGASVVRRRDDEDNFVIKRRIAFYRENSDDIINFLSSSGLEVLSLDASLPLKEVYSDLWSFISVNS